MYKKLWKKFNLAIKDFELWYLKYGDNSYYWYKTLGELTPDILSILLPELLAGKAGRAAEISEDILSKSAKDFSEKLEQKTAHKEVKESFNKAETELEDRIKAESEEKKSKFKNIQDNITKEMNRIGNSAKLFDGDCSEIAEELLGEFSDRYN